MAWLQSNWIWFAAAAGFLALHCFGHGGHGRHNHGGDDQQPDSGGVSGGAQAHAGHDAASAEQHRHGC